MTRWLSRVGIGALAAMSLAGPVVGLQQAPAGAADDVTPPQVVNVFTTPAPKGNDAEGYVFGSSPDADVAAAEFFVDADPGAGSGSWMEVRAGGTTAFEFGGRLGTAIAAGEHTVSVRARDAAGNWSAPVTVGLTVVATPPVLHDVSTPSPKGADADTQVTARTDDADFARAEFFVDADPGQGNGAAMGSYEDGTGRRLFGSLGRAIPSGEHTVSVRAVDRYGNWSAPVAIPLTVVLTPPVLVDVATTSPKPNDALTPVTAASYDPDIARAEFFVDADPGQGNGGSMWAQADGTRTTLTGYLGTWVPLGDHTVYVRAMDNYGTWSEPVAVPFTVVATPPSLVQVSTTNPKPNDAETLLTAVTEDPDADTAEFFVDADPGVGNGGWMWASRDGSRTTFTGTLGTWIPTGEHTMSVRARDTYGNWSEPTTIPLSVVPTPPVFAEVATPSPKPNDGDTIVKAVSYDTDIAWAEFFVDTDPGVGNGGPMNWSHSWEDGDRTVLLGTLGTWVPVGDHVVYVRARDHYGNWSEPVAVPFTVVPTPPVLVDVAVRNPVPNDEGSVLQAASPDQDVSRAEWFVDTDPGRGNGGWMSVTQENGRTVLSGYVGTFLSVGEHTLYVRAVDFYGNWSEPVAVPVTVVATPPVLVDVTTPNPKPNDEETPLRAVSYDADLDRAEWFVDTDPGVGNGGWMSTWRDGGQTVVEAWLGTFLSVGEHTLYIRARDTYGNWSNPVAVPVTVVTTPPVVSALTVSPDTIDAGSYFSVTAESPDRDVARAEVFVDAAEPQSGQGGAMTVDAYDPTTTRMYGWGRLDAAGEHTVTVIAYDQSGTPSAPVSRTVAVRRDAVPPTAGNVAVSPNPKWVREQATLTAGVADNIEAVGAEWYLDADPGAGQGRPMTVAGTRASATLGTDIASGRHTVFVRAVDPAGNWSEPASVVLDVWEDTAAPAVQGVDMPEAKAAGAATAFSAAVADNHDVARAEFFVDRDPGVGQGTAMALTAGGSGTGAQATAVGSLGAGLAPGDHVVGVRAADKSGNWSAAVVRHVGVYDPALRAVTDGGWFDKASSSDGTKATFSVNAGYTAEGAPDGVVDVKSGTVSLHATAISWVAAADGTASGVAYATPKNDGRWTIRFTAGVGADRPATVRVYRPGVDPYAGTPALVLNGAMRGSIGLRYW